MESSTTATAQRLAEREREHAQELQSFLWAHNIQNDPHLTRVVLGLLHPDAVQHPDAKAQMHKLFTKFEPVATFVRKQREQRERKAREAFEERSQRAKEAATRRKAAKEAKT
jgi:hypothetical protein